MAMANYCSSVAQFVMVCAGVLAASSPGVAGKERVYYIGIVEENWNYSPNLMNNITGEAITPESPGGDYVSQAADRIGPVYKKALYKEFTDATFSQLAMRPAWLGFLGPMVYAEVGDTIRIEAKNMAGREYSLHPHGVFYLKESEGAVYEDNKANQAGDRIDPGDTYTYKWVANERAGPAEGAPNCVPWMYHSHIESTFDTNAGLTGYMVICRAGTLDDNNQRTDVDKDFILMFTITDENLSYYLDENIAMFTTESSLDPEDADFISSNQMDSVNGLVFGALPGLDICLGDTVEWHILVIGTEIDVHTVNFHGNVLEARTHRVDTLSGTPAALASATMVATNPGTWLIKSHVVVHSAAGAQALYTVNPDCGAGWSPEPLDGVTRQYYIAAVEEDWNYGPSGVNGLDGKSLTDSSGPAYQFFTRDNNLLGGTYVKARYKQYTDATFSQAVSRSSEEEHLGVLGPVIKAEVGDTIVVTFRNNATRPYSIHPRGVAYNKANEGMRYNDGTDESEQRDDSVAPGATYNYTWTVPASVGPTATDEACVTMMYSSAVDEVRDMYSGLVGPMLICRPGSLDPATGQQTSYDRDFVLLFLIFDENLSWYLNRSIQYFAPGADPESEDFIAANIMTGINGYSFANLPGVEMTAGQSVCWHLADLGKDTDQHTAYFHQLTFDLEGRRVDSVPLFPGVTQTIVTQPDNPGTWLLECATNTHFTQGMTALYTVGGTATAETLTGVTRTYYVAAVEMEWDYTPDMYDPVRSQPLTDENSPGYVFVTRGATSIGSKYRKAVYRAFDDATFVRPIPRLSEEDRSLGLLGPTLRAEVGDTLTVVFRNMATRNYSMHPHNLFYSKANEGDIYGDSAETPVMPGETRTYTWTVPASKGPTEGQRACIPSVYYSSVNRVEDTNAGLVGPLIVCRPGTLDENGRRTDVDKEFSLFFSVTDENTSHYIGENINHYCLDPGAVDVTDPGFVESNLMHGINGFLYNNLHHLEMSVGERVAWNLLGIGDEVDLHTVHFHGQTVTYRADMTFRLDVSELFPGSFVTVEMVPDNAGIWLLHCHVNDHILAGMETFFEVQEAPTTPVPTTPVPTTAGAAAKGSVAVTPIVLLLHLLFRAAFAL